MDLAKYAALFVAESHEHLRACNQLLIAWEREPGRAEPVGGLFRAIHSIKGMAATLGYGDVGLPPRGRVADRLLQRVAGPEQQLEQRRGDRPLPAAQQVQQAFQPVGEVGDAGVAHRRRHALHRVHRAEDAADRFGGRRLALPLQQQMVERGEMVAALGEEELRVLPHVHGSSRAPAARPPARARAGTASPRSPSPRPGSLRPRAPAGPSPSTSGSSRWRRP